MNCDELKKSSIAIAPHTNNVYEHLLQTINTYFSGPENGFVEMTLDEYRGVMLEAQRRLVHDRMQANIALGILPTLTEYLKTDRFLIQSNLYLRASRPHLPSEQENIGWHRESFYGPGLNKSVNIWTPVRGVTEKNSLRYIPKSQQISDSDILAQNIGERSTKRYSVGHKLGFNYDQKVIISGVDLTTSRTIVVPRRHSAVFSGNLIHGAAVNRDTQIRFSVDFQIIRKSDYSAANKTFHFSSGRPYFVEI
jgi:hypothetical protein